MPTIPARCRHLHTDGRQCGSPALRGQPLCYHHRALREPIPVKTLDGRTHPQLPAPDDFLAIQRSIAEVLRLLAHDEITDRRAATLLRGLANASQNLGRHRRDARYQQAVAPTEPVTALVNDPQLGPLALETKPDTLVDTHIPAQQYQDLSPDDDNVCDAAPDTEPTSSPQPRFTPNPTTTAADDYRIGEMYWQLQDTFLKKRQAFEVAKTAELEAKYEALFESRIETELANRLEEDLPRRQPIQSQPARELQAA